MKNKKWPLIKRPKPNSAYKLWLEKQYLMSNKLNKKKTETIIVRVDFSTKTQIHKLAESSRRTESDYLRLIIEDAIKSKKKI